MTDSITKGIHYLHSLHPFIPSSIAVRSTRTSSLLFNVSIRISPSIAYIHLSLLVGAEIATYLGCGAAYTYYYNLPLVILY